MPPVTPKHVAISVRFGSLADIEALPSDVRFTPESARGEIGPLRISAKFERGLGIQRRRHAA